MSLEPIDKAVLDEALQQQYLDHGYCRLNRAGDRVVDDAPLKARVYDAVRRKVARSKDEVSRNSFTNGELYALTFPNAPGASPKALRNLEDLEFEVRRALMRRVWGLTQPRMTGYIQKRLGADGLRFVLCRTLSTRGLDDVEVCFVTDDEDLIMTESVLPQVETLVRKANDLRQHTDMVLTRRPELTARVTRELGLSVRRVAAALPHASANGDRPESPNPFAD